MVNRMAEFIIPGATLQVGEIDVKYMRIYQDGVFFGFWCLNQEIFFQMGSQSGVSNHCIWGLNNYIQCSTCREFTIKS